MNIDQIRLQIPFFQAPNDVFEDKTLSNNEKLVYLYLCRCGNNSTAFPSYNAIAEKCNISRRTAINTVNSLCEKNYLIKKKRYTGVKSYSNVYEINTTNFVLEEKSKGVVRVIIE